MNTQNIVHYKLVIAALGVFISAGIVGFVFWKGSQVFPLISFGSFLRGVSVENDLDMANAVVAILGQCLSKEGAQQRQCYHDAARRFHKEFGASRTLQSLASTESNPVVFEGCHATAHFLGREEYERVGDVGKALAIGSPICFAGYYHGVLEGYLAEARGDLTGSGGGVTLKKFVAACGDPTSFLISQDYYECLHGLGHALLVGIEDLPKSLETCDMLSSSSEAQWCYSGVFMENSTSSTNRDHSSAYLKKDDPSYPCSILAERYLPMCYTLQTFYVAELAHYDWPRIFSWCGTIPAAYQDKCFNAIGQVLVGFTRDINVMMHNCALAMQASDRHACIQGVVGALAERYPRELGQMATFCNGVKDDDRGLCYERMNDMVRARVHGNATLDTICGMINEEQYRQECQSMIHR